MLRDIKHLLHSPVIIKKIRFLSLRRMGYPEELPDLVFIRIILFSPAPHTIIQEHRHRAVIDLLDAPPFPLLNHRLKLSPGYMVIIRMDRHVLQRRIIRLGARLKHRSNSHALRFAHGIHMEIPDIIQTLCKIRIHSIRNPGVEVHGPVVSGIQHNL